VAEGEGPELKPQYLKKKKNLLIKADIRLTKEDTKSSLS
jgi:hypothetical protein